jgi:hypothetical protein
MDRLPEWLDSRDQAGLSVEVVILPRVGEHARRKHRGPVSASGRKLAQVGDMVYLHDRATKVSRKNVLRWCMVVTRNGSMCRICPRSTTLVGPVFTGVDYMDEFDQPGWFSRFDRPIATHLVDQARNIGALPDPARSQLLNLYLLGPQP